MKKMIALSLLLPLLLAVGCQPKPAEAPAAPTAAPAATAAPAEAPAAYAFVFTAQTLDGETMTEEVLSQHDLTMVNVWASWCGPCRSELPELAVLYGKLPENVGFLSVTMDEPSALPDAKAILEKAGCTFPCLNGMASSGLYSGFLNKITAIPTTLFLDKNGNQVGQWILGVPQGSGPVSDIYLSEIQARLDSLNGK